MQAGKHIDFTGITILDGYETGQYTITRVNPADHRCEACMKPAEYELRSEWDVNGQCTVNECQACILEAMTAPDTVDTYIVNS